jgi:hypothetical protein
MYPLCLNSIANNAENEVDERIYGVVMLFSAKTALLRERARLS